MFRKKVKICKYCGEINSKKASFCACCRRDLDHDIFKIKRSVHDKEQLKRYKRVFYYLVPVDGKRRIEVKENLFIERNSNDELFDNVYLSNKHALLFTKDDKLFIRDLGSTNGTFINDVRIPIASDRVVLHEDLITFANVKFKIEAKIEVR